LYTLYRIIQSSRGAEGWKSIAAWVGMIVIGLGVAYFMASIVLMPMREYLPFSIRGGSQAGAAGGGLSADYATKWSFSWLEIFTFFLPSFSGFGGATYWGDSPFTTYPHYLGISVVILAAIGFWTQRKHRDFGFWVMLLVFSLLIAMGKNFALLSNFLLNYLPYFNKFREPSMILILFSLGTAILAGFGFQAVLNQINRSQNSGRWVKTITRGLIAVGALALAGLVLKGMLSSIMTGFYHAADQTTRRLAQFQDPRQINYLYGLRFNAFYKDYWLMLVFAGATLGLIWAGLTQRLSVKSVSYLLIGLIVVDLAIPGRKVISDMFAPLTKQEITPRATAAIKYLQKQPGLFRVFPVDEFTTNKYAYYNIASLGGYHAAKMGAYQDMLDGNFLTNFSFLRLTNTRYLISRKKLQLPILQLVQRAGNENIYMLNGVLPRAWFVDSVIVQPDADRTLKLMRNVSFDPAHQAILDQTPESAVESGAFTGIIKTLKHDPELYQFETSNEKAGLLILSEADYPPGWQATVDGNPAPVYRTDHILQAVMVPAGSHQVVFRFASKTFHVALWLSRLLFFGVLIILVGYAGFWFRKQHQTV